MEYNEKAILKTLAYSDIFDFPLTSAEIWKFLISEKKISKDLFKKSLQKLLLKEIFEKDGYFCLKNRERIINKRKQNSQEVEKKLQIAKKAASYLSHVPSILFIGLSGGLAMNDADQEDDIDFFIITKKQKLFQTRFWILMILQILGFRRSRYDKNPANKICVNFLIDETKMIFPVEKHDLYLAHEIVQIKPLFEREDTYSKFFGENVWVNKFFPNATPASISKNPKRKIAAGLIVGILTFLPLETFLRTLQIAYMKKSKNTKRVKTDILTFHPNDYRVQILNKMRLKFQQLGLLTKL